MSKRFNNLNNAFSNSGNIADKTVEDILIKAYEEGTYANTPQNQGLNRVGKTYRSQKDKKDFLPKEFIDKLKANFGNIERATPVMWKKIEETLDKLPTPALKQIYEGKIRKLGMVASMLLDRRKQKDPAQKKMSEKVMGDLTGKNVEVKSTSGYRTYGKVVHHLPNNKDRVRVAFEHGGDGIYDIKEVKVITEKNVKKQGKYDYSEKIEKEPNIPKLQSLYKELEDGNYHGLAAQLLVTNFGTPEESREVYAISARHAASKEGISKKDQDRRDELSQKYYSKLFPKKELTSTQKKIDEITDKLVIKYEFVRELGISDLSIGKKKDYLKENFHLEDLQQFLEETKK